MADEKNLPPHLRGIPPALLDKLDAEQRREVAELHTDLERQKRERRARGEVPEGLTDLIDGDDALRYAAARLWTELPPRMVLSSAEVERAGRLAGLDATRTGEALAALQHAELATSGPEGVVRQSPGSVPF